MNMIDLENIFIEQSSAKISNNFEDFFIVKMIARQDKDNKFLVSKVNDKAIGMMAISTDINISFLAKYFELKEYDNLLCQDYMEAVNLERKKISEAKAVKTENELKHIEKQYH